MKKITNNLVLRKDDYLLLISYLDNTRKHSSFDKQNAEELTAELKKAILVAKDDFPNDVVGLNSKVRIKTEGKGEEMELTLVTPDKANIKEKKISYRLITNILVCMLSGSRRC